MRSSSLTLTAAVLSLAAAVPASAQTGAPGPELTPHAVATLQDTTGATVGRAALVRTPNDSGVLIRLHLEGFEPGTHGFHIHETGGCEPTFAAAGGHLSPAGRQHGLLHPEGPHAGDLPNVHVPADGNLVIDLLAPRATLEEGGPGYLLDEDGSALIIHRGADPYTRPPQGDAAPRIACGVVDG